MQLQSHNVQLTVSMFVALFFVNFLTVLYCAAMLYRHKDKPLREAAVAAGLLFSAQVFLFTETLSLFNAVGNPNAFAALYTLSTILFIVLLLFIPAKPSFALPPIALYPALIGALVFLPLVFVAVFYPPCTWDSMSYHLPRIDHWIQNGNVELYPTAYPRQLYYQPFAEYLMLSPHLLSGTDYFDNLIQIIALLGIIAEITLLTEFFGGTKPVQTLAALTVLACPTVVFEAPTTQTDLIASFYFLAFLYFGLKLSVLPLPNHKAANLQTFVYALPMSLALGLSLNTKVSVAVFELPFCVWFGYLMLKRYRQKVVPIYAALALGFVVFNTPYFARNAALTGNIFGPPFVQERLRNAQFGLGTVFSNSARIIGMQLKLPNEGLNAMNRDFLKGLHTTLGIKWNDPKTSYMGDGDAPFEYDTQFYLDDNRSGNIWLVLLFVIVAGTFSVRNIQRVAFPVFAAKRSVVSTDVFVPLLPDEPQRRSVSAAAFYLVILGFFLYNALFRWQPFGTRLLLPDLLAGIPFLAIGLCRIVPQARIRQLCPLLLGVAVIFVTLIGLDWSFYDPLSASGSVLEGEASAAEPGKKRAVLSFENIDLSAEYYTTDLRGFDRWKFERNYKYFRKAPLYFVDYMSIADKIAELGVVNIGLAFDVKIDRWEYPLWALLKSKSAKSGVPYRIEWVVFPDYLEGTANFDSDFVPDVVLTDLVPQEITNRYVIGEPIWRYKSAMLILVPIKGTIQRRQ